MNDHIDKQRAHESLVLHQSRVMREVFDHPLGPEALKIIFGLCGRDRQLPLSPAHGARSDDALYWYGRGDVGRAIQSLLDYQPREEKPAVHTKRRP